MTAVEFEQWVLWWGSPVQPYKTEGERWGRWWRLSEKTRLEVEKIVRKARLKRHYKEGG